MPIAAWRSSASWRKIVRRSGILLGSIVGLVVALLGLTLGARTGLVAVHIARPEGQWLWYISRAAGVTAYVALVLATVWGLLLSTSMADAIVSRGRSLEAHRWLSAAALALSAAHAIPLIGDRYVGFDLLDVVVPFLAPYRPTAVGLGIGGLYLALAVYGSFWLRAHLGQRGWRAVHVLSFPAFGLVTLHGLYAGTDSGAPWLRMIYLAAILAVGVLTVVHVLGHAGPAVRRASARAQG
jgi:predicted ferric reductase